MGRRLSSAIVAAAALALAGEAGAQDLRLQARTPARAEARGWRAFGAELGFLAGGAGCAGVIVGIAASDAADGDVSYGLAGAPACLLLVPGAMVGGLFALGHGATRHGWGRDSGWGAAGTIPGMVEGVALAGGILLLAEPEPSEPLRWVVMGLGSLAGAVGAYFLFDLISKSLGSATVELACLWAGVLLGEVVGLMAFQGEGRRAQGDALTLVAAAGGGALSLAIAHGFHRLHQRRALARQAAWQAP
jgi:hypothetical protein